MANASRYVSNTNEPSSALTMDLFGLPYQFPAAVDPRIRSINEYVGRRYTENILMEGPILTIIPGKAVFMPGQKKDAKTSMASALLSDNGDNDIKKYVTALRNEGKEGKNVKLYDIQRDYARYMRCVDLLCRTGAVMLGLEDEELCMTGYNKKAKDFQWRNYKWTKTSANVNSVKFKKNNKKKWAHTYKNYQFIQFYVDADSLSFSESNSNGTEQSKLKSVFDAGSSAMRELRFMANTIGGGSGSDLIEMADAAGTSINNMVSDVFAQANGGTIGGDLANTISRIVNAGANVLKGDNIIIPDIYANSSYSKSYDVTIKLKSPYGTKLGYYLNIFVPMMHLLALSIPIQSSANTTESPFLVKAYVEGSWSCNLGLVESISITKNGESRSVEGLPNEVDVTLSIRDLYSDLSLTDQTAFSMKAKTSQFLANSSLVEFLATNCGLSISQPNFDIKVRSFITNAISGFRAGPANVAATVQQNAFSLIESFTSLT